MEEKKPNNENSRRKFIKQGLTYAAATAAGASLLSACKSKTETTGDRVKVLTQDGELVEIDKEFMHTCSHYGASGKVSREGIPGRKFVMVIDLSKCKNARKCVQKCQKMHHIPSDMELIKVQLMRDNKNAAPYWMPKPCFHCDEPPCVSVCPVGATFKRTDGCVLVDNTKCIGCKFCMTACPYSARVFNWGHVEHTKEELDHPDSPETGLTRKHGTVSKCDFCPDMARQGKLPDCVTACPNGVIYYGDINEDVVSNGTEVLRFSSLIRDKAGYRYAEDLGTQPSVYYLPPSNRMFPFERGLNDVSEEQMERYEEILKDIDLDNA